MGRKYWPLTFGNIRIDLSLTTERGVATGFSANLSVLKDDKRIDMVRWDTSHGFLHKHEFWRTHRCIKTRRYEGIPLHVVFEEVKKDLIENRERYAREILDRIKKGGIGNEKGK